MSGIPAVVSIGTLDPWNAAGLGLDIRALAECGVRPLSVAAGFSAQDERGVHAQFALPPEAIAAQFAALASAPVAAYRIGALLDAAGVAAVARALAGVRVPVVYDPVFAPSAGGSFADDATVAAVRERLLPRVTIVTPNLAEAARLLGSARPAERSEMLATARALQRLGPSAVLLTGGHLPGRPLDVLAGAAGSAEFEAERIAGEMRGTGCLLAAALAAALAHGRSLRVAVEEARAFVRTKLRAAQTFGPQRVAY